MVRAVAYCRMSTEQQEHSIDSQLRLIREYAVRNGYSILSVYKDEGISGRRAEKRPAFLQMIDDSATGDFQAILIYDSSRFARNLEQSIVYKSILKKNGVELVSITEPSLDEDTSLITDALFGAMNEMYSRKLSKNVKRGLEQKALRGEYLAAPPFGYCYLPGTKRIIADENKAKLVVYLFGECEKGRSAFSLAKELGTRGVTSRYGLRVDTRQIQYILTNPAYKGFLRLNIDGKAILKEANIPAILDCETFDRIQQIIKVRRERYSKKARPAETTKHWLSGLLRCSECGNTVCFQVGWRGRSDRFRCAGVTRTTCQATKTITVRLLEELITQALTDALFNPQAVYEQKLVIQSNVGKEDYGAQLKRLNQRLERAKTAYLEEIDTLEEYKLNKQRLSADIKAIEESMQEEPNNGFDVAAFVPKLENVLNVIQSDDVSSVKQAVMRSITAKITVDMSAQAVAVYFYG